MSLRKEQCNKVCRILDNVLANRPTERDSLIVAVRKAFKALAEPSQVAKDISRIVENGQDMRVIAQPERIKGHWICDRSWSEGVGMGESYGHYWKCDKCGHLEQGDWGECGCNFCSNCGSDNREEIKK